ncbi:MAG: response regulator [Blastocatellia bacterium]
MPPRILIVDDDAEVASTCARVLKGADFDCLIAYDGPSGLYLFDFHCPALVLSDINLPAGTGFDIARHVRRVSPATPVILMTAYHSAYVSQEAIRAGAMGYLRKPFSNTELISSIKSFITA